MTYITRLLRRLFGRRRLTHASLWPSVPLYETVAHHCTGLKQNDDYGMPGPRGEMWQIPCLAWVSTKGKFHDTCGEPCSFIMCKGGSAFPEWPNS